jgi:hypothetical protein
MRNQQLGEMSHGVDITLFHHFFQVPPLRFGEGEVQIIKEGFHL